MGLAIVDAYVEEIDCCWRKPWQFALSCVKRLQLVPNRECQYSGAYAAPPNIGRDFPGNLIFAERAAFIYSMRHVRCDHVDDGRLVRYLIQYMKLISTVSENRLIFFASQCPTPIG
jgi:hypothetical protein